MVGLGYELQQRVISPCAKLHQDLIRSYCEMHQVRFIDRTDWCPALVQMSAVVL